MQARAYGAQTSKARLAPMTIERRDVGPRDVLIDIAACGVCHSDIHQAESDWGMDIFPMVPGHEIVGTVSAAGSEVTRFAVGDRVGVGCYVASCGECDMCDDGHHNLCPDWSTTYNGYERDGETPTHGGYSDHIVVDSDYVIRIPEGPDTFAVAPLLCAGITVYPPLKDHAGPGAEVAVVGLGGLGHVAARIAKAMGSRVTVISHSPGKEADALRLGADAFRPRPIRRRSRHCATVSTSWCARLPPASTSMATSRRSGPAARSRLSASRSRTSRSMRSISSVARAPSRDTCSPAST